VSPNNGELIEAGFFPQDALMLPRQWHKGTEGFLVHSAF